MMMQNDDVCDYLIKIIMFGDAAGKSSIVNRFIDDTFSENIMYTVGVDFRIKTLKIDDKIVKVQIWDTSGQERFRNITVSYYRGANGIIYVYDVLRRESFDHLNNWIKEVELLSNDNKEELIIGNKTDRCDRCIMEDEAIVYSKGKDIPYIEVSAKTGHNIDNAFTSLIRRIIPKLPEKTSYDNNIVELIQLDMEDAKKPKMTYDDCC